MPYVKIWVHIVFGTKDRERILVEKIREDVINHILANARTKKIFIDTINGYQEHLHCLISLGTEQSIAKVVNLIKGESSHWININSITKTKFEWANEYYASSISDSEVENIRRYIMNQVEHHKTKSFTEEYEGFIDEYGLKKLG
jgi:REP element-mobilizing transposase RayT